MPKQPKPIPHCGVCPECGHVGINIAGHVTLDTRICMHAGDVRFINRYTYDFPDWCPLPDAPEEAPE